MELSEAAGRGGDATTPEVRAALSKLVHEVLARAVDELQSASYEPGKLQTRLYDLGVALTGQLYVLLDDAAVQALPEPSAAGHFGLRWDSAERWWMVVRNHEGTDVWTNGLDPLPTGETLALAAALRAAAYQDDGSRSDG